MLAILRAVPSDLGIMLQAVQVGLLIVLNCCRDLVCDGCAASRSIVGPMCSVNGNGFALEVMKSSSRVYRMYACRP